MESRRSTNESAETDVSGTLSGASPEKGSEPSSPINRSGSMRGSNVRKNSKEASNRVSFKLPCGASDLSLGGLVSPTGMPGQSDDSSPVREPGEGSPPGPKGERRSVLKTASTEAANPENEDQSKTQKVSQREMDRKISRSNSLTQQQLHSQIRKMSRSNSLTQQQMQQKEQQVQQEQAGAAGATKSPQRSFRRSHSTHSAARRNSGTSCHSLDAEVAARIESLRRCSATSMSSVGKSPRAHGSATDLQHASSTESFAESLCSSVDDREVRIDKVQKELEAIEQEDEKTAQSNVNAVQAAIVYFRKVMSLEQDKTSSPSGEVSRPWIHTTAANVTFGTAILLNAIFLGIEADYNKDNRYSTAPMESPYIISEWIFLSIFSFELILRIKVDRGRCFRDMWNIFDLMCVVIGILHMWVVFLLRGDRSDMTMLLLLLSVARAARVLRIVRLFRYLRELVILAQGIYGAIKALGWAMLLIFMVLYICAVITTNSMSELAADDSEVDDWFGSVGKSLLTLFQLMTLEEWPRVVRGVMERSVWTWVFFVPFMAFTGFILLNLVTAIVVERIIAVAQAEATYEEQREDRQRVKTLRLIKKLWSEINTTGSQGVGLHSCRAALKRPEVLKQFVQLGLSKQDAEDLFDCLNVDGTEEFTMAEFCDGLVRMQGPAKAKHLLQVQYDLIKCRRSLHRRLDSVVTGQNMILELLMQNHSNNPYLAKQSSNDLTSPLPLVSSQVGSLNSDEGESGSDSDESDKEDKLPSAVKCREKRRNSEERVPTLEEMGSKIPSPRTQSKEGCNSPRSEDKNTSKELISTLRSWEQRRLSRDNQPPLQDVSSSNCGLNSKEKPDVGAASNTTPGSPGSNKSLQKLSNTLTSAATPTAAPAVQNASGNMESLEEVLNSSEAEEMLRSYKALKGATSESSEGVTRGRAGDVEEVLKSSEPDYAGLEKELFKSTEVVTRAESRTSERRSNQNPTSPSERKPSKTKPPLASLAHDLGSTAVASAGKTGNHGNLASVEPSPPGFAANGHAKPMHDDFGKLSNGKSPPLPNQPMSPLSGCPPPLPPSNGPPPLQSNGSAGKYPVSAGLAAESLSPVVPPGIDCSIGGR